MDPAHLKVLSRCPLFRGLDTGELTRMLAPLRGGVRQFHQGARIAFRGDAYRELWIILSGYVNGEFRSFSGKVLKLETMHAPEAIATAVLFSTHSQLPVDLSAASDAEILAIPRKLVVDLFRREERILLNYLTDMGDRLSLLADKLRFVQFSTIRQKIAGYLLDLSMGQHSTSVTIRQTKESLAEVFGVTRPSLSRGFVQMCNDGIIRQEGPVVHIVDSVKLEAILEGGDE